MTKPIAILFNGGAYGTYLEWCLTTLTTSSEVQKPFTADGSSHVFIGNPLFNIDGWRQYIASSATNQFVRLHPKTKRDESITINMLEIAKDAQHIVYLYPDQSRILLCINNFFFKVWSDWMSHTFENDVDPNKIYENWPVSKDVPIDQIPTWIKREFLSYYLMPAWYSQIEWDHRKVWQHPKSITVTVSELLFDFENTLSKIQKFCNLEFRQPISNLAAANRNNLNLQKYLSHDQICQAIIKSVKTQSDFTWEELSLPSEAWLQWELRNQGLEIRCDGLDTFPTTSIQLRELLYPV